MISKLETLAVDTRDNENFEGISLNLLLNQGPLNMASVFTHEKKVASATRISGRLTVSF